MRTIAIINNGRISDAAKVAITPDEAALISSSLALVGRLSRIFVFKNDIIETIVVKWPIGKPNIIKFNPTCDFKLSLFEDMKRFDVCGTSKGKGYAGVMKRHGFGGFPASHGCERKRRAPGSISLYASDAGHGGNVKKGKRMVDIKNYNRDGKEVESLQVDESLFGNEVRPALLKQAIVMYHANKRVGTGCGASRIYRLIGFKRNKNDMTAMVKAIEYDSNRNCFVSLVRRIIPEFIGFVFEIHNGKMFHEILVFEDMVGHKLGEFLLTRMFYNNKECEKDGVKFGGRCICCNCTEILFVNGSPEDISDKCILKEAA